MAIEPHEYEPDPFDLQPYPDCMCGRRPDDQVHEVESDGGQDG